MSGWGWEPFEHRTRVDLFGGSYYAYCRPSSCGWTGPFRRWRFLANRDARRHGTPA